VRSFERVRLGGVVGVAFGGTSELGDGIEFSMIVSSVGVGSEEGAGVSAIVPSSESELDDGAGSAVGYVGFIAAVLSAGGAGEKGAL
jgi:hypothetical protein